MAHSALTALTVLAGSSSLGLTWGDVNRHPGSLLHSVLRSVDPADDGASVELDLPSLLSTRSTCGKFSHFPSATAMTVALYKHGRLPIDLLSDATKLHNSRDLLEKLQQLLDFLNLPGPVSKYLPPKDGLPLRYMGILDLHIEAAAQRAVDLMLSSFLSASDASTLQAAFFCVQVPPEEETNTYYEPVVYSLSGYYTQNIVAPWPKGSSAAFTAGNGVQAFQLPTGSGIGGITSSSSNARRIYADDLMRSPAKYGHRVSNTSHTMLFERISTVLSRELPQVPYNGRTGALQSCSFTAHFDTHLLANYASSVWGIWW